MNGHAAIMTFYLELPLVPDVPMPVADMPEPFLLVL
jgi:hypothetical protein